MPLPSSDINITPRHDFDFSPDAIMIRHAAADAVAQLPPRLFSVIIAMPIIMRAMCGNDTPRSGAAMQPAMRRRRSQPRALITRTRCWRAAAPAAHVAARVRYALSCRGARRALSLMRSASAR